VRTIIFYLFNGKQDLIDAVKPEHIKQIGELLKDKTGDDELIKQFKEDHLPKNNKKPEPKGKPN
jgi:hypothetical protein